MSLLQTIVIALACFSAIPMPFVPWDEGNMRHMICAMPLVGVIIGFVVVGWYMLCTLLDLGTLLRGAGMAAIPLMVSGGIHMDGFADVVDAQSSHATPERKRQILKDPHTGAFATMGICVYLMLYLALCCDVSSANVMLLSCTFVISRCACAMALVSLPAVSSSGMMATIRNKTRIKTSRVILAAELAAVGAYALLTNAAIGAAMLGCAGVTFAWTVWFARRQFGGMSGDMLGFFIQLCELVMLACIVFMGRLA